MKKFTKHILLLALMLFGVAGAAWAQTHQKYTGPVAKTDLVEGDTLAPGFSITGLSVSNNLGFDGNRYKQGGVLGNSERIANGISVTGYGGDNPVAIIISETILFTPVDESGQDGNAWVVTYNSGAYVFLSGIYIAPDPTVPALDETTGNWNFLMPGSNKVVKAVLLDSIVLGPHVSVAVQPVQDFISYTRPGIGGDSTVLYYDPTLANSSFGFIANDDDGQGRNFAFWADDQNNHNTDRDFGGFSELTCGQRFVAVYPDNHTLTLVTPQGGGTVKLDGERVDTFYNITFEHDGSSGDNRSFTIPASRLPYDTTFNYDEDIYPASVNEPSGNLSIINQGAQTVTISISGAFIEHDGSYSCMFLSEDHDNWTITCEDSIVPVIPYGIRKTGNGTYSVMEGLTVNVTATPDSAHYLSAIGNEAVISNSAYNISFTMPDDDAELAATFTTKPTLTLAQTAGGTLEAIVPQGGVTAMHLTTDQIPTWSGNTEYAMEADLQQFGFVAVDSAAAAAWTGAPASGYITLVYALAGNKFKVHVFQDGQWYAAITFDFYKADFYTSPDVFYFTTGTGTPNVIASSTPNTYYIDYGTPVTVKATPDAQHYLVSFSDDAPATERNSNLAVEKTYDSVTGPIDLSATFQAKPQLILTATDGGTLTLDGYTPGTESGTTTVTFGYGESSKDGITLTGFPWSSSVSNIAGTITSTIGNITSIVVNGYYCSFAGAGWSGNDEQRTWTGNATSVTAEGQAMALTSIVVTVTTEGTPAVYPDGVTATETENQYRVDYGTEVTVTATPDSIHYLATLGGVTMGSNTAKDTTFALTATTTLDANFAPKPTLTLAHNDGGEMEVIPAGGLTAIVPPTDQIALWEGNYAGNLAENDLPATLGFVAVNQAAAEAWTGAPASGNAMLIYDIDGEYFHYLSFNNGSLTGNDEGTSTPGGFYNMASAGTLYITTGVTPSNVTATAEPNTYYIDYNTSVTVKATPAEHYHLQGWSNNVTDNGDSTASLTMTQNETVSATFAQNAPELAWEYDDETLANGDTISAYHGFEMDSIAKITYSSNDEFFNAYLNTLQNPGTSLLRFGSSNTNVVSFADAFDPQSLSVNAPGTATVYMVHDGSVMAYDSAWFTAVILAPDTLTLVHNEGGEMTVETLTDSIRAIVADTTYAVVPGANVTVKATPDSVHYLADFDGTDVRNSNIAVNNTFTVTADTTLTANFEFKPTLTLVHNDGGEMEVMSAGGVTAIVPPTDKLSGWESNYEDAITEDDIPAALGFVAVDQAAAEAWTGVPASGDAMLIYGIDGETFYCLKFHDGSLSENSTFHFYPGGFYSMASVGILYITTGVTPSNVIASTEPNTYYIDYNTSVTVKATPSDTAYLVRFDNDADANSNVAVEKTYGPLTANVTATATFHAKPTLTLAQNENWGKVMLEGAGSGSSNGYTIKFSANGNTIVKENVTLPKTYQCAYGSPSEFDIIIRELYGWDGVHGNANAIPTVTGTDAITPGIESSDNNYPKFTINSAFQGTATVTIGYTNSILVSDNWPIEISFVPALPAGVAQLDSVTYRVDYGTEVTVNAEATELHHVAGWQDEADNAYPAAAISYDNYAITEPANLFPALSTLTLTVTADTTTEVLFGINSYDVAATAQLDSREEIGTGLAMGRISAVYADIDGNPQFAGPDDTLTYTAQGGSSSILIADTNYGYLFAGWYDANADTLMSDLPALSLTEAYEVEARFVPDTFEVSYTQNIATAGTIEGADRYPYLTNMTLVATPATGYHFVNWKNEEGDILGTAAELPIQVLRDSAITAILDTNVYDVVANVNIEGLGTVTGAGEVKHFLSTTLVATANMKYHFVKWINAAGDSVSANTTIEVFPVGDTTLTAVFDTNIYATVWSGETATTYTSLPYTGLTATYTDFWGNEHTPVLTFVCGSQTVVTPNYPVTAGTWTVTATPEVGDSLTSPVTTLTINRAIVNITGTMVETAKFYDENTDAVVTNAGTLNNVQGSDAVTHTTTASYSDATVGDGKTITVNYTLHGTSALLANYTLTPASEEYTTNGAIIEPMEPRPDEEFEESDTTEVDNGFEVYAYGYCTGTSYRINYQLRYGYPDQYKLDFTDSRFTDVDWTNLPSAGRNGHIDIDVPVDLPTGDYTVTVTFRDSRYTWLESTPLTVTFHVNLPETYTRPLFKNVIALVDTCHCFTDIQWYYRADATQEWAAIPGATGYYYHANADQLDGQFFVKAKMNGVETFTCPQTDVETLITDEDGDISMDVFPNPTTDRVTVTVNGSQQTTHTLRILNTLGVELESGTFEGDITTIDFSRYQRGSYMVSVDGTVVRVIRN